MAECEDCGAELHQEMEKALGNGEWKMVWTDGGSWVCPITANEHSPV